MLEFSDLKEMPKALAGLQETIKNPVRDKKAYNYKYADMDTVLECIKKPSAAKGFSIVQMPFNENDMVGVETMLIHESGEYIKGKFGSKMAKQDPQSVGSQISYYRRYSLLSIFNLAQEDDDGATATKSYATRKPTVKTDNSGKAKPDTLISKKTELHSLILDNNIELTDQLIEKLKKLTMGNCVSAITALKNNNVNQFNKVIGG